MRASIAHASSPSSPACVRCFVSSASAMAKAPGQPAQKKKSTLHKNKASGPRSIKKRTSGDTGPSFNVALTTHFYKPPRDMSSLPILTPEDANISNLNEVMAFSRRDLEAFGKFGVERKVKKALDSHIVPSSLVRQATLDLYTQLASSASASSSKKLALTGPLSGGKSHLMLQAVSYALASDWLVVYLPHLISFINSSTAFVYSEQEQAYLQPDLLQNIFHTVLEVNQEILEKIKIDDSKGSSAISLSGGASIPSSSNLKELLKLATTQTHLTPLASQQIFDLFLTSISQQSAVPVLFALDHLQALYLPSRYRTADYEFVQSYELAPIRSLLQFVAGKGLQSGTILAAENHSNPLFPIPNELKAVFKQQQRQPNVSAKQLLRGPLDEVELHAYARTHPLHLEHAKASNWSLIDVPASWTEGELRALYELRRKEGRNWNGGDSIVQEGTITVGKTAARGRTAATATEDELFLLRVMESGKNPEKFDKSVWGSSSM